MTSRRTSVALLMWLLVLLASEAAPTAKPPASRAASTTMVARRRRSIRGKRSVVSLRNMVRTVTGIEPLMLVGYANWCGYGGEGEVLDPIDDCCHRHDICFDRVHDTKRCAHLTGYQTPYHWRWLAGAHQVQCADKSATCQFAFCECDRVFAECLRRRKRHYQPGRYLTPSVMTAAYYGTYLCWFTPACWVMGPQIDMLRYAFLVYHLT